MFTQPRDEVLDGMGRLGARLCGYCLGDPADWVNGRCDCKYGGPEGRSPSERTGCPEVRLTYMVVAAMTDAEWDDLSTRMGGVRGEDVMRAIMESGRFSGDPEGGESA